MRSNMSDVETTALLARSSIGDEPALALSSGGSDHVPQLNLQAGAAVSLDSRRGLATTGLATEQPRLNRVSIQWHHAIIQRAQRTVIAATARMRMKCIQTKTETGVTISWTKTIKALFVTSADRSSPPTRIARNWSAATIEEMILPARGQKR
jgi:hypothetical protein